ncbi:hypothetical protein CLV41_10297 [Roseibium marinum]|uniref:Uncharacterized protein n=1 Tax=Roseibium marinum TaxID=281252 RepID=A0A2S3UYC9_9HYPH|nr:hypothetical protein CLV41_10297 [Roseibium marinum]
MTAGPGSANCCLSKEIRHAASLARAAGRACQIWTLTDLYPGDATAGEFGAGWVPIHHIVSQKPSGAGKKLLARTPVQLAG